MTIDYDAILLKIVDSSKKTGDNSVFKNILEIDTIGNVIVGRMLPNIANIEASVIHYYHHGWKSKLDANYMFYLCLNTVGDKCPICTQSIKMWKSNDPVTKESSKPLRRRENWLVNFYVISDKQNPKNNGTIQILRMGKQLHKKYENATSGIDKDIYGSRIWRLDAQGCNFRIMCEQNSESKEAWPTYNNSSFMPASVIDGMTDVKQAEILKSVFDLSNLFTKKSADEMLADMRKHYFTNDITTINEQPVNMGISPETFQTPPLNNTVKTNETPTPPVVQKTESLPTPSAPAQTVEQPKVAKKDEVSEDQIDKMLKELQGG